MTASFLCIFTLSQQLPSFCIVVPSSISILQSDHSRWPMSRTIDHFKVRLLRLMKSLFGPHMQSVWRRMHTINRLKWREMNEQVDRWWAFSVVALKNCRLFNTKHLLLFVLGFSPLYAAYFLLGVYGIYEPLICSDFISIWVFYWKKATENVWSLVIYTVYQQRLLCSLWKKMSTTQFSC